MWDVVNLRIFPIRSCITCRKRENPSALLRFTLVDGKVIPDLSGNAFGRGAWVHKKCLKLAINKNAFRFAFKQSQVPDISELQKYVQEMDAKDMKLK